MDTKKISIRNAKFAKIGLEDLCEYIGDMSEFTMVEIGCYVGDSTEIFIDKVKHIHCVDPWENGYDEKDGASENISMLIVEKQFNDTFKDYKNITIHKMQSNKAYNQFPDGTFDLVYIDGLHTYEGVKEDIDLWLSKVKIGGFIAGHDYGSKHFPGVKKAVDEYFEPDKTFKDSSWIKRI